MSEPVFIPQEAEHIPKIIEWARNTRSILKETGCPSVEALASIGGVLIVAYSYGERRAKVAPALEQSKSKPKRRVTPWERVTPKTAQRRAAKGRRDVLEGKRPAIKDAIKLIMGSKTMTADEVMLGLKNPPEAARKAFAKTNPKADPKSDWLPDSKKPRMYIAYLLSSEKAHFIAGPRGHYRAKQPGMQSKKPLVLKDRILAILTKKPMRDDQIARRLKVETRRVNEALKGVKGAAETKISGHRAWRLV